MSNSMSAAAAALVAVCAASGACGGEPGGPPGGMAFPPVAVQLERAAEQPVEQATEYVATLRSLRSTTIHPQIDGQITRIEVKSGERVTEGQRLLQIDPRRQEAAVESQEAERAAREADVAFAEQQQQRAAELFKAGAISRQEFEQAETALQTARARLQALRAQVQQQQVQLRYYTVTAPTAGIVGDIPVRVGNQVGPQTLLTTIDQNDTLEVHVQVPIERAPDLKNGLPLRILSSDGGDVLAESAINFVSPHVDDQSQTVLVKGTVANRDGRLRSSQYVRARIVWATTTGLVVPVTAVARISGQHFAFVAEETQGPDGKAALVARQRPITVGPIEGDHYTVLNGLKPGERIVVAGAQKLADGAPIVPAAASNAPAPGAPSSSP
jgi:RND family efflux transporter MFP subunit